MNVRLRMACLLFGMSFGLYAQQVNSTGLQEMETAGWYRYTGSQSLSAEAFIEQYHQQLGLGEKDRLELQRVSYGKDGSEHRHYQQLHQGIPVEAGELIIHLRNNAVYLANGEIVSDLNLNPEASISESQALQYALNYFPAQIFAWEAKGEARPQGNLVILNKNFSKEAQQYQLSWKFDVYSYEPYDRNWVYINAQNGSLSHSLSRIHSQDTGTARTKYSGTRSIYTSYDSDSALYVLHDSLTGGGIYTFNMQKRTNKGTAIDFYDDDNYWNNFNANFDEAATDAHWGAERVYSYFKQHYNRFSYDDQNSPLNSFVHYDSNYVNAFWNGQEMTYGDGNGVASTPLISLDVVAHEITHGITEYTANLIYQGESGALNESFSDIFGAAIEFAYDSAGGDWKMGEDFLNTGNGLRNLRNPAQFNHPNTYKGNNWGQGLFFDNGYVHSNSGVQNFWYYLLSDGDSGVNDNNDRYDIEGLGYQAAADIAYHNLDNYLTRFSDHFDARMGAMQSAIDLYGACSNEYIQTTNAWYAVGVGEPTGDYDLSLDALVLPERDCSLGAAEDVIFVIRNNSCAQSITAGTAINLSYSINGGLLQTMSTVISNTLLPDSVAYIVHSQTADLSQTGNYDFFASISTSSDSLTYNNTYEQRVRQESYQNAEWKLLEVLNPISGCELNDSTNISLAAVFLGCDSLAVGTNISLDYSLSGTASQNIGTSLSRSVHYGDTLILDFPTNLNMDARGAYTLTLNLVYSGDPTLNNNRIVNYRVLKPYELLGGKIGFEDFAYADSLLIRHGNNSSSRRNSVASTGNRGLEIVGGPLVNYSDPFEVPRNDTAVWQVNPSFRSTYCTCVDARQEGALQLNFDLQQAYTRLIRRLRSEPSNSAYTSSLRVLANGQPVSGTFIASNPDGDGFQSQIVNLDDFAGQYFELCFETHLLVDKRTNSVTNDGDIINLDNIYLGSSGIGLKEPKVASFSFALYPNPHNGDFNIRLEKASAGTYELEVQDFQGRVISKRSIQTQAGDQNWNFSTDLAAGTYFVLLRSPEGKQYAQRMIIQ
ncbi:M4 family metallopeptidase [Croceimicrobium hydrocarbonivorans]|uniref:M4 family metallopeptidase n=1 Tax=Croceimicrobium hydrocarbonivorans TaxID=2761580 RepID=A0A7H0VIU7_9FLAO|nr:M4 family metallopeptidase [Croceimicrobium hydrocarbonivorans]QNR25645.1 M4 family metallopeptidase [Croceimicrobium hydrocarbonivorans]